MLGGIAGHAGLFSTGRDVEFIVRALLFPEQRSSRSHSKNSPVKGKVGAQGSDFLNATTIKLFTTEYNNSQSSRALGWNTNDPTTPDRGWDLLCGNMSASTFMHTGYTGACAGGVFTCVWTKFLRAGVLPCAHFW